MKEEVAFVLKHPQFEGINEVKEKTWTFADINNKVGADRMRLNLVNQDIIKTSDKIDLVQLCGIVMLGLAFVIALVKCGLKRQ